MGIIPIWGFQLLTAIAGAFIFKLNKALVIIAANISIPPMIPFILFLSLYIGGFWMGDHALSISINDDMTLDLVKKSVQQYILGAFTLAILAGFIFTGITFAFLKLLKKAGN